MQYLYILLVLLVSGGLLYWINTSFDHKKYKNIVLIGLWSFSALFFYKIVNEFWLGPKNFESVKEVRFQKVIKKLTDIRDSELAFRSINGQFEDNWDSLVKFIEVDSFTLTQRRDSSVIDKELTKRYGGVKTYKDIIIVDTLGFVSVRDSLFGDDNRYTSMMFVPYAKDKNTMFVSPETGETIMKKTIEKFRIICSPAPKANLFLAFRVPTKTELITINNK